MHLYPVYSLAQMTVSSSGTGTLTADSAYTGLLTFEVAGVSTAPGGQEVTYAISESSQSEVNRGIYYSSAMQLVRSSTTSCANSSASSGLTLRATAKAFAWFQSSRRSALTCGSTGLR